MSMQKEAVMVVDPKAVGTNGAEPESGVQRIHVEINQEEDINNSIDAYTQLMRDFARTGKRGDLIVRSLIAAGNQSIVAMDSHPIPGEKKIADVQSAINDMNV